MLKETRSWVTTYDDGGICFGYYIDFIKDGMGIYWDANGNKFRYEAKNGEVLDVQAGFGADSDTNELGQLHHAVVKRGWTFGALL